MSCSLHSRGSSVEFVKERGANASDGTDASRRSRPPDKLTGTWDFKWPVGTQIRVAFQRLPNDVAGIDYEYAKSVVDEKLRVWLRGRTSDGIAPPRLSYALVGDLPAPPNSSGGRRPAKSCLTRHQPIAYDVLVSFLPLPVVLPIGERHPEELLVGTPASALGRYARRTDYGIPTLYVGPLVTFAGRWQEWFTSAEGVFTVAHELGHVLGLPHETQNPYVDALPWRDLDEMVSIVEGRGELAPEVPVASFIKEEIQERWPGPREFSDWREPAAVASNGYDFDSVMAKPSYRCLLEGVHDYRCTPAGCEIYQQELQRLNDPTASDLRHLLTMYGERAAVSAADA